MSGLQHKAQHLGSSGRTAPGSPPNPALVRSPVRPQTSTDPLVARPCWQGVTPGHRLPHPHLPASSAPTPILPTAPPTLMPSFLVLDSLPPHQRAGPQLSPAAAEEGWSLRDRVTTRALHSFPVHFRSPLPFLHPTRSGADPSRSRRAASDVLCLHA